MIRVVLSIAIVLCGTSALLAQQAAGTVVAARVSGQPITRDDVERQVASTLKSRTATGEAQSLLEAQALSVLVDRQVVNDYLQQSGEAVSADTLAAAVDKIRADLKSQGSTLEAHLKKLGLSEAAWRRELVWQLNWQKYLAQHATDADLQAYFKAHPREFDGTEVRARHILLRASDAASRDAALKQADELRRRLMAGDLAFADAAQKYSTGPSKKDGGDLGFFPRHGRMDESFSAAAFALDKDQMSPPIVTPFGVHLIQVTDVKPGAKTWTAVHEALEVALARDLFEKLAAQARPKAKIEFTGAMPHFKPGTQELVEPK